MHENSASAGFVNPTTYAKTNFHELLFSLTKITQKLFHDFEYDFLSINLKNDSLKIKALVAKSRQMNNQAKDAIITRFEIFGY